MKAPSIASRVVAMAVVASVFSAVTLAGIAAVTARILWRESEQRSLQEAAAAVARAIRAEAAEDHLSVERAAGEAIAEQAVLGYHVEVWSGSRILARRPGEGLLGPPGMTPPASRAKWLVATRGLPGGITVAVAVPKERGLEAMGIFRRSLVLALPICLLFGAAVGAIVARRATRPLREFAEAVVKVRDVRRPTLPDFRHAPAEVRELEQSFGALLDRIARALARELEFAANASHELRTPLTRIRLRAERARADAGKLGRAEIDEQIGEIDRMVRLVDALLVLARDVEAGIPIGEDVNLADLVRERAARLFGNGARLALDAPDEALVRGDEDLLGIAVENLLDNARKYAPDGSTARIRVSDAGARIEVRVVSPGSRLPAGAVDRVFERFFRGDEARPQHAGHGLGLSLAQHIAELHRGALFCEQPEEGLAFVLLLPRWSPESAAPGGVS